MFRIQNDSASQYRGHRRNFITMCLANLQKFRQDEFFYDSTDKLRLFPPHKTDAFDIWFCLCLWLSKFISAWMEFQICIKPLTGRQNSVPAPNFRPLVQKSNCTNLTYPVLRCPLYPNLQGQCVCLLLYLNSQRWAATMRLCPFNTLLSFVSWVASNYFIC